MLGRHAQNQYIGHGTAPIAIGLAALIVSAYVPALPAISAMALVAAGATQAFCSRVVHSHLASAAMAAHLFVYLSLYFLFVGAVVHAAMNGPHSDIGLVLILDLAASMLVMRTMVRKSVLAMLSVGTS